MEERNYSVEAVQFMVRIAAHIRPVFPHYAAALMDEVQGRKMTSDRWNRVAAILSSLHPLPGRLFGQDEHDARNPALSAVLVAQQMALSEMDNFMGRFDPKSRADFAIWVAAEIDGQISPKGTE